MRGKESLLDRRSTWWLEIVGLKPGQTTEPTSSGRSMPCDRGIREATLPERWPPEFLKDYLRDPMTLIRMGRVQRHPQSLL